MCLENKNIRLNIAFKLICAIGILSFAGLFSHCAEPTAPIDFDKVREAAYNSLGDYSRESITGDWKTAEVKSGFYLSGNCENNFTAGENFTVCFFPIETSAQFANNQILAAVIFNTKDDPLLGPIIVIVDPAAAKAVGFVGRE